MIQDSPIFITGIERSGSTIVARVVNHCGAFAGITTNMFENKTIKKYLDLTYDSNGWDRRGQYPLPNGTGISVVWHNNILRRMEEDGYNSDIVWMLKGSRLCQMWSIWHYAFPNAKWIIVRRKTNDIIDSCLKTGYMTAYKNREGWLRWVREHEKFFVEMIQAGVNCKQIWPERMANEDFQQIKETIEWAGLIWNEDVIDLVKPLLWNSKQKERSI